MSDLEISPEDDKLNKEFNRVMSMDRFKARNGKKHRSAPKKAVKHVEYNGKKYDESNVSDLDISKEDTEMNKRFNALMDRETRFKSVPVKKANKAVVNTAKSSVLDVSDLDPTAE